MKNFPKLYLLLFLIVFISSLKGQAKEQYSDYYILRENYRGLSENDTNALESIQHYIAKAKKEKNYQQLIQGYLDGILYSSSPAQKLKFADSTIYASKFTCDNQKISAAYLEKGVVYYFHFKNYKRAMDEYMKAYQYSKKGTDEFYEHRLIYLMGTLNNYIGKYDMALEQLKVASGHFENQSLKSLHPNLIYNNLRGYLNSIHQMAVCYRNLGNFRLADSLITKGISETASSKEYMQEYGYFLKEKGIQQFRQKQYTQAINSINSSIKAISAVNDFAWVTVCYSYIGKSYHSLGDSKQAVSFFKRADSIFKKHNFIFPEVRSNYELLMDYYKTKNNVHQQYFYSTQLIKADRTLYKDFDYLTTKISKEYNPSMDREANKYLRNEIAQGKWSNLKITSICLLALLILIIYQERKQNRLVLKYKKLEHALLNRDSENSIDNYDKLQEDLCLDIKDEIKDDILKKLDRFEKNGEFIEFGLTAPKLARKFDSNSKYLTLVILQYKGMAFKNYLAQLRISYITERLYNDRKYLGYTLESLANECGIGSRANFSKKFEEINGIKPTAFIQKRLKDLKFVNERGTDNFLI
ncbi:helix-turn-helix domain-containing protein [Chryseobacterium sp. 2987]|uniref:helix-turn-helix domain-containing protein n=1 Tax=Chryseobacterium sp. 2987 TaxID=2817767 RepID=UPI00285E5101|nr:helix-turn-helix domain-containing protein [Chryseobacterium sp. 2987]MDR6919494.1 AraC-like DNA-binding protein [Chryseobacterium sp. 2987]